jgi:hypothetical protein
MHRDRRLFRHSPRRGRVTIDRPPRFAGRLLKRLVPGQDHDVLLGDLNEEYQRGRSKTWYFLQILAAIVVGSWKDLRAHKIVAARAVATGIIAQLLAVEALLWLRDVQTGGGLMLRGTWIGLPWYWHYPYYRSTSFAVVTELEHIACYMLIGWLIVRLHRGHGVTMLFAFCSLVFALRLGNLVQLALLPVPTWHLRDLSYALVNGQIREWLVLLLGGYLATRQPKVA